ncbi:glutaredoxin [Gonapodya prolifera JEL478]|uniref:Glutaredoxin n=1 Tax=Gonapodya prolifera (strain JEL478) TaxID=1344416 RepID=A0A139ATR0_GONPJ|nr:glutaredoxin [Gonapodya prolifera JEL478]|eukprot:KXS20099.1 glutaredoxin [Gonapodya prolifera JEL478]
MPAPTPITSPAHFDSSRSQLPRGSVLALNFWAEWAPQCKNMNEVFAELAVKFPDLNFWTIEAEEIADVSEKFEIDSVPTFIVLKDSKQLDRISGADAAVLTASITKHASSSGTKAPPAPSKSAPVSDKEPLETRLKKLVSTHPVMLFMKGTPSQPRCGFSRQVVEIFEKEGVKYGSFNILADDEVRQGLKTFSNWPTFPQIYVNSELIGGLDILKEMIASGEFHSLVPADEVVPHEPLEDRLKKLISRAPVMLFMKGSPGKEKCGFSRQTVAILKEQGVAFDTFDILSDEEVRQGLKEFSKWPTYPQVYANGELLGGLDVIREMAEAGELKEALTEAQGKI